MQDSPSMSRCHSRRLPLELGTHLRQLFFGYALCFRFCGFPPRLCSQDCSGRFKGHNHRYY